MNIFLFNKSLRLYDNTTLIDQILNENEITPFFIFTEQINQNKNKYFSHNSVQFMCESLDELSNSIKLYNGKLYLFHSDNLMKVFEEIIKNNNINSIGTNFDYSPYALYRQDLIEKFCNKHNIKFYMKEDHVLYNILNNNILKKDGTPYTVYTPFKNYVLNNLEVPKTNSFKKFKFKKYKDLEENKYYINKNELNNFYTLNKFSNIKGGRKNGLDILKNIKKFNNYNKERDYFIFNTTFLSAHNHFGTLSIREIYKKMKKYNLLDLINQLIWRDFYYGLYFRYPHMLNGQIGGINKSYKPKFDHIKWNNDENLFNKWANGKLGIPVCDAGMNQLNKTGFLHNRLRMICANILTKLLLLPWQWGEEYFAKTLIDYDCIQNSAGWHWTCCGIDPQQPFRIFNPELQSKKFDSNCIYIKYYIPELNDVPISDIHLWENSYEKYSHINYPPPQINYKLAREHSIKEFKKVNKN